MNDITFPIEFIGGSKDGEVIEATAAPDYYEVIAGENMKEIYERQNSGPPFIYVQIGYAGNETCEMTPKFKRKPSPPRKVRSRRSRSGSPDREGGRPPR